MRYDQILHLPTVPENFTYAGGVLDFFIDEAHIDELFPGKKYTRAKFTFQRSDHLPVWIQVKNRHRRLSARPDHPGVEGVRRR